VVLDLGASGTVSDHITQVKMSLEQAMPHGMSLGLLRYMTQDRSVREQLDLLPEAEVSFNYLGQFDQTLEGKTFFGLAREHAGPQIGGSNRRTHLLGVAGRVVEGGLEIAWNYGVKRHDRRTIDRLARVYMDELREIIRFAGSSDSTEQEGESKKDHPELSQKEMENILAELQGGEDL